MKKLPKIMGPNFYLAYSCKNELKETIDVKRVWLLRTVRLNKRFINNVFFECFKNLKKELVRVEKKQKTHFK